MSKRKLDLDELLELETRDALRHALQQAATPMSTQIQRIAERAAELSPAMVELRLAVVHITPASYWTRGSPWPGRWKVST